MIEELPSLPEVVSRMQRDELRPGDLVEACLARIEAWEPQVRAWVLVDAASAHRQAESLARRFPHPASRPPLYGVPMGIKDIIDVAGWPTRGGSPRTSGELVASDSPVVQRLRAAGAILLGKTVTTELACFDPPPTRNPWNLRHTPGGSSSGSAAAVAAGMCLAALGSQTGGSITRPASYCGISGLKPWFGAVSIEGVLPISEYLDHVGPMARRVADLPPLWQALCPDAPPEPASPPEWTSPPVLSVVESCDALSDPEVRQATREALERLRQAGARLVSVPLPDLFGHVLRMHRCLMAVGIAATYGHAYRQAADSFGPCVGSLIEEGLGVSAVEFAQALRGQTAFRRQMRGLLQDGVTLVCPATVTPAPADLTTTGDPRFNSPWSFSGLPTCCLPISLSQAGLPCGLQLVGGRSEWELLSVARWCELQIGFDHRPEFRTGA